MQSAGQAAAQSEQPTHFSRPGVLEAVELVAAAEARIDRRLLLRVLDRDRALDDAGEGRPQPAQGLAEGAVGAAGAAGLGPALDLDDHVVRQVGELLAAVVLLAHQHQSPGPR